MKLKNQVIKREKIYGLDIGDSGIRIASVSKEVRGLVIEDLLYKDLPYNSESIDRQIVIQSINDLANKLEEKSENIKVVTHLYNTEPIVKFYTLPYMTEEEVKKTVKWQAQRLIVQDLEKMIVDYAVLNTFEEMGRKKLNIVFIAVPKERVLNLIELLKETRIEPISISIDCLAQYYLIKEGGFLKENEVIGLIDIGAKNAVMQIIDNGVPCFVRKCTTIGSWEINKFLKTALKISFEESEKTKREFSINLIETDFNSKVKAIINKSMEEMLIEIKRSLDYFYDIFPQKKIEGILLTGGGALLNFLDTYLTQGLGIKVERFDPLRNLNFSEKIKHIEILQSNSLRFTTVLGLALEAIT